MLASSVSQYPVLGNDLQEVYDIVCTVLEHSSISHEVNLSSETSLMMSVIESATEGQVVVVGPTDNLVLKQRLSVIDSSLMCDFNHKSRLQVMRRGFRDKVVVSSLSNKKAYHLGTTHIYSSKLTHLDSKTMSLLPDLLMIIYDYWRDASKFEWRVNELKSFLRLIVNLKSCKIITRKTVILIPNPIFEGIADRNKFYLKVEKEFEFFPISRHQCGFFKAGDEYVRQLIASDYYDLEIKDKGNFKCIHSLNDEELNKWRPEESVLKRANASEPDFWVLRMKYHWQNNV
jgi:hypothetical protein